MCLAPKIGPYWTFQEWATWVRKWGRQIWFRDAVLRYCQIDQDAWQKNSDDGERCGGNPCKSLLSSVGYSQLGIGCMRCFQQSTVICSYFSSSHQSAGCMFSNAASPAACVGPTVQFPTSPHSSQRLKERLNALVGRAGFAPWRCGLATSPATLSEYKSSQRSQRNLCHFFADLQRSAEVSSCPILSFSWPLGLWPLLPRSIWSLPEGQELGMVEAEVAGMVVGLCWASS